jgi:hypothetical protein
MEQVIFKGRTSTGIVLVETQGDKTETLSLRGIRAGLSWPAPNAPGIYLLLGQSTRKNTMGDYMLHLLKEGQESIPSKLFEQMTNDLGVFFGEEIYSDVSERFKSYVLAFDTFRKQDRRRQRLYLKSAPFYQDFSHGIFTIRGRVKENSLQIPKNSIVYEQLKSITTEDLKKEPEERFFAINALRFAVGAFEISDCVPRGKGKPQSSAAPPVEAFT